jgi:hypothetical protein
MMVASNASLYEPEQRELNMSTDGREQLMPEDLSGDVIFSRDTTSMLAGASR